MIAELPNLEASHLRRLFDGEQHLYRFANGYGGSVVRHQWSYGGAEGKWELAVIKYTEPGEATAASDLCYSTPITDDVMGWLTCDEVAALLHQIAELEG